MIAAIRTTATETLLRLCLLLKSSSCTGFTGIETISIQNISTSPRQRLLHLVRRQSASPYLTMGFLLYVRPHRRTFHSNYILVCILHELSASSIFSFFFSLSSTLYNIFPSTKQHQKISNKKRREKIESQNKMREIFFSSGEKESVKELAVLDRIHFDSVTLAQVAHC